MTGPCRRRHLLGAVRDRGSTVLELSIVTPGLILLLGFMVVVGRVAIANNSVTTIAGNAARAASLARDARAATAAGTATARSDLIGQALHCEGGGQVSVDAAGFASASTGTPGQVVEVTVTCVVSFADLAIPGLPGTRSLSDRAVSPIDPNRGDPS
jgi:Flp pilus assembly protein TadG